MGKIVFLVFGEKMFKKIKKYIDIEDVILVEIIILNVLEEVKNLIDEGVKVIFIKLVIKIKIEDKVEIFVLSIENNIFDYIEFLKEIDIKNNRIVFVDYIEVFESLVDFSKIIFNDIVFKIFISEEECEVIVKELKNKLYLILIGSVLIKKYVNKYDLKFYEVEILKNLYLMYIEIVE